MNLLKYKVFASVLDMSITVSLSSSCYLAFNDRFRELVLKNDSN